MPKASTKKGNKRQKTNKNEEEFSPPKVEVAERLNEAAELYFSPEPDDSKGNLVVERSVPDDIAPVTTSTGNVDIHDTAKEVDGLPESYDAKFVDQTYNRDLRESNQLEKWAFNGYLEDYLWKFFDNDVSLNHLFSIVTLFAFRRKCQDVRSVFKCFSVDETKFSTLFQRLVDWYLETTNLSQPNICQLKTACLQFFQSCYFALECKPIRNTVLRYVSLPIWFSLSKSRRDQELEKDPALTTAWKRLQLHQNHISDSKKAIEESNTKSSSKKSSNKRKRQDDELLQAIKTFERDSQFFPDLLQQFFTQLLSSEESLNNHDLLQFIYDHCDLFIDLLGQIPTRRYLRVLLSDQHFLVKCHVSPLYRSREHGDYFRQVIRLVDHYLSYPVSEKDEKLISHEDFMEQHDESLLALQQYTFEHLMPQLKDLAFSSLGQLGKRSQLERYVSFMTNTEIVSLVTALHIVHEFDQATYLNVTDPNLLPHTTMNYLKELIYEKYASRPPLLDPFRDMSVMPNEVALWNEYLVPYQSRATAASSSLLPKVNLHYLSIEDYLMRHLQLLQSEYYLHIREDLMEAISRCAPKRIYNGSILFNGWSNRALPILSMTIDEVLAPKIGEAIPRQVKSTITIDIARFGQAIRDEWEMITDQDIVYLIDFDEPLLELSTEKLDLLEREKAILEAGGPLPSLRGTFTEVEIRDFLAIYGIKRIRGGQVVEYLDETNVIVNPSSRHHSGTKRKLRLNLDSFYYYQDQKEKGKSGIEVNNDPDQKFQLLIRANVKDQLFISTLNTVRRLLLTSNLSKSLPPWLTKTITGSGSIQSAHFRSVEPYNLEKSSYYDSFLDLAHIKESFPNVPVTVAELKNKHAEGSTFYRLEIHRKALSESVYDDHAAVGSDIEKIVVHPFLPRSKGPYPENSLYHNSLRFLSRQIQAVRSGLRQGLTVVAGPSASGKTTVAAQLVSTLYHNYPQQKILVTTKNLSSLRSILSMLEKKDIHPRHLLYLDAAIGVTSPKKKTTPSEEGELATYGIQGRIDWCLFKRMQLLGQVQRLAQSLQQLGDVGATCETASYFYNLTILPKIELFWKEVQQVRASQGSLETFPWKQRFPFSAFFQDVLPPLFEANNEELCVFQVESCLNYLYQLFEELNDYRNFEFLRTAGLRRDYLLSTQAGVVLMTSDTAAVAKDRLQAMDMAFDSVVIDEASQILDIESFLALVFHVTPAVNGVITIPTQKSQEQQLKRIVLLGDPLQSPPTLYNTALTAHSHLQQSLFAKLLRLQYPVIALDPIRFSDPMRSSIASLPQLKYVEEFCPAYEKPLLLSLPKPQEVLVSNAGFLYSMQWIDMISTTAEGGEILSSANNYSNLVEAEYIVAVYQYMCLLGYPTDHISIVTVYPAQQQLLLHLLTQRGQWHTPSPRFGKPRDIVTISDYQGRDRNDYLLFSLVRTQSLVDPCQNLLQQLMVVLSRVRLGAYLFGSMQLIEKTVAWAQISSALKQVPTKLTLLAGETYPTLRIEPLTPTEQNERKEELAARILEIEDVSMMGMLVYQMTQQSQH